VDVHIRRLRSKIEERHTFIETVRNVGYRFRAAP
jgi:DNA-binding response OmpR family regulator